MTCRNECQSGRTAVSNTSSCRCSRPIKQLKQHIWNGEVAQSSCRRRWMQCNRPHVRFGICSTQQKALSRPGLTRAA